MQVLWAPWRMEYILGKKEEECIFCNAPEEGRDRKRLILYADHRIMVIMNKYPYVNGHLLVSPIRHVPDLSKLTDKELLFLLKGVKLSINILKKVFNPDGFNVGLNIGQVAGAGIEEHLHFHIVPRWNGDTNYMTVLAEVRVIPEHILETYDKLAKEFSNLNLEE